MVPLLQQNNGTYGCWHGYHWRLFVPVGQSRLHVTAIVASGQSRLGGVVCGTGGGIALSSSVTASESLSLPGMCVRAPPEFE